MTPRPALLIPVHNRRLLTLGCLRHLRALGEFGHCEIVVVDDGSTDGTGEAVRAEFPEAIVLRGDGQLFWTGAIALAMRETAARGAPVIWLNDDCRPRPGALPALRAWIAAQTEGIAGARCIDAVTGLVAPTGFIGRRTCSAAPGAEQPVEGLSGFCVGLGAGVVPRLGLPDAASFPHYFGDTAYTLRASRASLRVVVLGDAVADLLDHHGGPPGLRARIRRSDTLAANWTRLFSATGSPYRLSTLFAAQRLKYGPARGTALAAARAMAWIARLVAAKIS